MLPDELNQQGLRVVAVANKILPAAEHEYGVADESDLILEGYIAFLDPPKESTAPALAALEKEWRNRQDPHRRQRTGRR
ncbi:Magnesium-transporting ATPase, P-type 1 [Serratia fonticola]|uniref:Magnesium-transporting ATPase, P-type 1 n=1 Tax=Serratia fonticola TaxID=47917 RepID=A0A4U9TKY3_SERFO|nr:Magnesium-transporting ATPase, P-type 1 [Serratia fonticola]